MDIVKEKQVPRVLCLVALLVCLFVSAVRYTVDLQNAFQQVAVGI